MAQSMESRRPRTGPPQPSLRLSRPAPGPIQEACGRRTQGRCFFGGRVERMLRNITAWVLSDGKAGDELQCLGVTDALGIEPEIRRVDPRAPWRWLMPHGPVDPAERAGVPNSPIAPPFPDLLIASGRRAVSYLRRVKRASGGRTYTVYLKDPRTSAAVADLIWVPVHDRLRAPNVVV